jgi:hypothetical protein
VGETSRPWRAAERTRPVFSPGPAYEPLEAGEAETEA